MSACLRFAPMIGARPGELTGEEAAALAEHVASCESCQARLADEEALSGMLSQALMGEANRRDFSTFSDEVLARIPAYSAKLAGDATGGRTRPGVFASVLSWARRHRFAAAASALAPALAVVALILYLDRGSAPEPAWVDISAEGRGTTILETSDGPVVLLGDPEPEGS